MDTALRIKKAMTHRTGARATIFPKRLGVLAGSVSVRTGMTVRRKHVPKWITSFPLYFGMKDLVSQFARGAATNISISVTATDSKTSCPLAVTGRSHTRLRGYSNGWRTVKSWICITSIHHNWWHDYGWKTHLDRRRQADAARKVSRRSFEIHRRHRLGCARRWRGVGGP